MIDRLIMNDRIRECEALGSELTDKIRTLAREEYDLNPKILIDDQALVLKSGPNYVVQAWIYIEEK